jgi:hypothetical protein
MSAVSQALTVETPKLWAETRVAPATAPCRWGDPIWPAEEPILALQNTGPEPLPLKIKLLAFVFGGG